MPRLSDTGLQEHDNGTGGNFKAWVNPKDLVGFPITITTLRKKHVDDHYFPSGDFQEAHDEFVVGFTFDSDSDAESVMFGDYEQGATYGFSTNAARIKSVLSHVEPETHLPLEGVCILQDERGKYTQLYLGDSGSGEQATQRPASEPTRPTTRGAATRPAASPSGYFEEDEEDSDRRPAKSTSPSTGGRTPTDRKTQTDRR